MCGITGYIGNRNATPILLKGLKRLEYRGYDSSGIAILDTDRIKYLKKAGKIKELQALISKTSIYGSIGIAHTRWATHGSPNDSNSHPHLNESGTIALVHNGIIENYEAIKETLIRKGVIFQSETDTEDDQTN